MSYYSRVCEGLALGSILALSFCATAKAQDQTATASAQVQTPPANAAVASNSSSGNTSSPGIDGTWHFESLSYLWFPGIHGTVGARGYQASPSVSPSDLISHFNFGLMGSFEAHYNRWGIPFDYVYVKVDDNKTFVNLPGYTANPSLKESLLTPKVTYLVVDGQRLQIKATAGIRYWHLGENLQLTRPAAPSISFGTSQNWVDVVGGANIVVPFSPKIAVMILGDAGGGGANVDYQVAGIINYQLKPKWGVGLGYRYVDVNYRNSNKFIFDTVQSGIALTLLYKYGKPTNQ
jgi:hypothetical protein